MVNRIEKVINAVPANMAADAIYLIRTGAGFDIRVSDGTGMVAHDLNIPFLDGPDNIGFSDDAAYSGWASLRGVWSIVRLGLTDSSSGRTWATLANNPGYADLATSWPDRESLTYA